MKKPDTAASNKIQTTLSLHCLELDVYLGWLKTEQTEKLRVTCDIKIQFLTPPIACETDHLTDTYCYDSLIKKIKQLLADKKFYLIETLAQTLHQFIKQQFKEAIKLSICITKKPTIPNLIGGVSFCYEDE